MGSCCFPGSQWPGPQPRPWQPLAWAQCRKPPWFRCHALPATQHTLDLVHSVPAVNPRPGYSHSCRAVPACRAAIATMYAAECRNVENSLQRTLESTLLTALQRCLWYRRAADCYSLVSSMHGQGVLTGAPQAQMHWQASKMGAALRSQDWDGRLHQ